MNRNELYFVNVARKMKKIKEKGRKKEKKERKGGKW